MLCSFSYTSTLIGPAQGLLFHTLTFVKNTISVLLPCFSINSASIAVPTALSAPPLTFTPTRFHVGSYGYSASSHWCNTLLGTLCIS